MAKDNFDFRSGRNPFGDMDNRIGKGMSYQPERNRPMYERPVSNQGNSGRAVQGRQPTGSGSAGYQRPYNTSGNRQSGSASASRQQSARQQTTRNTRQETKRPASQPKRQPESKGTVKDAQAKGAAINSFIKSWTIRGSMDPLLLILVFVLLCIGLVMMFSASYTHAYYTENDAYYYIKRQAFFAVFGVLVMLFVSKIDYERLNSVLAPIAYGASMFLLLLTFIVNIKKDSDFKRWLVFGSFRFQPSEIGKFTLILFLAYVLAKNYGIIHSTKVPDGRPWLKLFDNRVTSKLRVFYKNASTNSIAMTLACTFIVSAMCVMILIENHLSCTILIFALGVCMMWLGGIKKGYFAIVFAVIVVAVVLVVKKPDILPDYAAERIIAWLDKDYEPLKARWQTNQSLRAIASGGPFGLGLGNSRQKHMYVSEPQNDFIFAIVCEELGIVGGAIIICLFAALVWRAFHVAANVKSTFGALLIMGIALQIGIQVLLNIAVVTDTIPNTGISLPFFSYGGTSLVILMAEMGVALSVSRSSTIQKI